MRYLVLTLLFMVACGGSKAATDENVKETNVEKGEPTETAATSADAILPNDGTRKVGDVTTCLVSGNTFTVSAKSPAVEHEGGTYYMCCDGCVDKFKADPVKYLSGETEKKPAITEAALPNDGTRKVGDVTTCPVSGDAFTITEKSPTVEYQNATYYMCCGGCVDKFKADPVKHLVGTGKSSDMHHHKDGHKHDH